MKTSWLETRVISDALDWGRISEDEILFRLEVGEEPKNREKITAATDARLKQAVRFCNRTGVRLVYAQLDPHWVCDVVRWACTQLPANVAVVLGDPRRFGMLPMIESGRVTVLG